MFIEGAIVRRIKKKRGFVTTSFLLYVVFSINNIETKVTYLKIASNQELDLIKSYSNPSLEKSEGNSEFLKNINIIQYKLIMVTLIMQKHKIFITNLLL
ncbi:hypothetical protein GCM10007425_09060 [Lysinibacillus alkalisoli]|uniref:Uncharacterized protein n=1 Tax=Lysinibacillus alkalisoli TaxID=1911548 RepID=A0A917G0M3_9BACI|nr:hypothetical protein GCM10007425_09060 [Lysinibacillus alkalisoli]